MQSRPRGYAGSSPHTRGALHRDGVDVHPVRIIPAYAGSTRRELVRVANANGSSPHTRGAQIISCSRFVPAGIIPAYAGSTFETNLSLFGRSDHPRIRGEHVHRRTHLRRRRRIIPAYAGSTRRPRIPDA